MLAKYLKFFRGKKDKAFKEIKLSISDLREDSLENDLFTKGDVENIFD